MKSKFVTVGTIQDALDVESTSSVKVSPTVKQSLFEIKSPRTSITSVIDQVKTKLLNKDNSVTFVKTSSAPVPSPDVAVIQCFYGIDSARVEATNIALKSMLKSNPFPSQWVFVEAQLSESNSSFKWLSDQGVAYKFVKLDDMTNTHIKCQLWNIGVQMTSAPKLLFIDSDVMFCRDSWVSSAALALDKNDVISVHKHSYRVSSDEYSLVESVGSCVAANPSAKGYPGYTIGMTRDYFQNHFEQFDLCSTKGDDLLYWGKVLGRPLADAYPYKGRLTFEKCKADVKVGSTDEVCCHISHGPSGHNDTSDIEALNKWVSAPFAEFEMHPDPNGVTPLKMAYLEHLKNPNSTAKNTITVNTTQHIDTIEETDYVDDEPVTQSAREKIDLSFIQCFTGNDIDQIIAATRVLKKLVAQAESPSEWIFIEAQTNKNNSVFGWLKEYGIRYVFKKLGKEHDGLFLKHSLWNMGAAEAKGTKLCFVDSDIMLGDSPFKRISDSLDKYDAVSPWNTVNIDGIEQTSYGFEMANSQDIVVSGDWNWNYGIAFRRDAFDGWLKEFDMMFDDESSIWQKIVGRRNLKMLDSAEDDIGLPMTVGYACTTAVKLTKAVDLSMKKRSVVDRLIARFDDAFVVDKAGLLSWNAECKDFCHLKHALRQVIDCPDESLDDDTEMAVNIALLNSVEETYGEVNDDQPLIVFCGYKPNFKMKTIEAIYEKKTKLEMICSVPFTFVCFTDDPGNAEELEIDIIPFSSKKVRDDIRKWKVEIRRKDIRCPKQSINMFIK